MLQSTVDKEFHKLMLQAHSKAQSEAKQTYRQTERQTDRHIFNSHPVLMVGITWRPQIAQ